MTLKRGSGRSFFVSELWQLSRSGEGARDDDLLGGLEGGREETLEGGREDLEGPEMEELRELWRDTSCFNLDQRRVRNSVRKFVAVTQMAFLGFKTQHFCDCSVTLVNRIITCPTRKCLQIEIRQRNLINKNLYSQNWVFGIIQ